MKLTNGRLHVTDTLWGPLEVRQTCINTYNVQYGTQIKFGLSYEDAAHELGECIMHWSQGEGVWEGLSSDCSHPCGVYAT